MVVAIDGPSGVGKSTVARALADALGIPYLDTGAYYRAVTHLTLAEGVDPSDGSGIVALLGEGRIGFSAGQLTIDWHQAGDALRTPEVTAAVSTVAAHPGVRGRVVEMQRSWVAANGGDAVVEGRDIGTVVFPEAAVKVYLTADLETRARRRARDAEVEGTALEDLMAQIERRDRADSSREVSPLRPADDAVEIDTSALTVGQVVGKILDLVGAV